ncbi:FkbM family methyltransferase [Zavarzinia sp. CC-PAN008]|uniref:FkbM family methyltransferase n=1 Tax=Zavarzinia sp. CC-PAN008 TaxID=3243332 RepID=UPI003F743254
MTAQAPSTPTFRDLTGKRVRVKAVDIGANPIDGTPPYAGMLMAGDAEVVGFEPNPDALAVLKQKKGPFETYLPHAIGDGGRHTLHICQAPGMTSLLTPNPAVLNRFHGFPDWGKVLSTMEVDTRRLDDIPETAGVDLIKIDIQGGELMAFRNATDRLKTALVIHTEVEFLPLYIDQPLFSDVDLFLRAQGFAFHRFYPLVSRVIAPLVVNNDIYAGLSQTVWADAIFVRDFTRPDLFSDTQLLKAAAILHDCYQSLDLVLALLGEYDTRTGSRLGQDYLAGLHAQAVAASAA